MAWNANVAASVLRHVGTAGGTAVAIFSTLGYLSPADAKATLAALHQTMDGLQQAVGGVSKLVLVLGPAVAALMAGLAGASSTLRAQLKNLTDNKQVKVNGTIEAPPAVAAAVTSPQVVPATKASS